HGTECPHEAPVKLQSDQEEEQRDPELREEADLLRCCGAPIKKRTGDNADGDETDDDRLAQRCAAESNDGSAKQEPSDLVKNNVAHIHSARASSTLSCSVWQ